MAKITSDLIRGHTDTILLKLLMNEDMYGYEISKTIYILSKEQFELKEVTLYSSLKRLQRDGFITSYWGDESKGGRRKYYKITKEGIEQYKKNKEDWEYAKSVIEVLI